MRRFLSLLLLIACLPSAQAVERHQEMMGGMVGGYSPADVHDPFVKAAAQFAVDELVKKDKNRYTFLAQVPPHTHLKGTVVQAQEQVCSGKCETVM